MAMDTESWEQECLLEALEAYKSGLADAPHIRKWGDSSSEGSSTGAMSFVVSTGEVDRHGDTISVGGWQLQAYMRNPVFLWSHNYTRPAIGRAIDVWNDGHRLLARMEFAPTEFSQEVAGLYRTGYQKGVSVGFRPVKYEARRDPQTGAFLGINFIEQELLEISAAPVPANASALKKALHDSPRMRAYYDHFGPADTTLEDILQVLREARQTPVLPPLAGGS